MQHKILLLFCLSLYCKVISAQAPTYTVEPSNDFNKVYFNLKGTSASCNIQAKNEIYPVSIYCNGNTKQIKCSFEKKIINKSCYVNLNLQDNSTEGTRKNLAYCMLNGGMFNSDESWSVNLTSNKLYNLNLNYGIGNAMVDLSGLAVENLRINTGSAKVKVGSYSGKANLVEMDTFAVKVDLGVLEVEKINLSKARNIIADVGFGNLLLDFSDKTLVSSRVFANVGAGSLNIIIPSPEIPVIIFLNNSPLCHVKLSKEFRKISSNVYVNESYKEGAENLLTFNVDVALGNIVFKTAD